MAVMSTRTTKPLDEDLIDTVEVARLLGLAHRTSVSTYMRRYPDMPRPVQKSAGGHSFSKWSKTAFLAWRRETFGK